MNIDKLKEKRLHGDPIYPVSIYQITCPPEQPLLDLHWHDELEFLMVTEGRAVFRVDVNDFEVREGEAIFVNGGELHSGYVAGGQPCSFLAVVFHPDLLGGGSFDVVRDRYIHPLVQKKYSVPAHITKATEPEKQLLSMLSELFQTNRANKPMYELTTKGLLYLCLAKLLQLGSPISRDLRKPENGSYKIERLKTVVEYIESRYHEPIALKQLAGLVSMSESSFCRFFKKITAKSPIDFINLYRVQQAAALLKQTDKKIMEISLDVGFNNVSYFNTLFKQRFGCTPATYRSKPASVSVIEMNL
ncbi:AraC family transcriptional regulator [Paenibacillus thermotolerans]|uniref:AraC family transcriptional regulator n=1 Tax=Paenibacillus thermotolerans TaxID=3027807 RepID=UPI002367E815|nr:MULTISPECIES: AraC family transcriptional regulator [unclassified Paenibacillus]